MAPVNDSTFVQHHSQQRGCHHLQTSQQLCGCFAHACTTSPGLTRPRSSQQCCQVATALLASTLQVQTRTVVWQPRPSRKSPGGRHDGVGREGGGAEAAAGEGQELPQSSDQSTHTFAMCALPSKQGCVHCALHILWRHIWVLHNHLRDGAQRRS